LAPGIVTYAAETLLAHDCSTLGGNSGSPVIELASGRVAGLHFGGQFREANLAVPAAVIQARMARLGHG
jgi:V8-like Glu-specific endopeptidase